MRNLLIVASLGLALTVQGQSNCSPGTVYSSNATNGVMSTDAGDFECGKIYMDAAFEQLETKKKNGEPVKSKHELKIYLYRGKIYNHLADEKEGDEKIEYIEIATDAYKKTRQADTDKSYRYDDATTGLNMVSRKAYNMSADLFGKAEYAKAVKMAELSISIEKELGKENLNANYNAALSALMMEDWGTATKYFSELAEKGFGDEKSGPVVFSKWSYCLKRQDKLEEAFAVIQKGREKFPESSDLFKEEVSYYLETDQSDKALANIDKLIADEPENPAYYALKGDLFDKQSEGMTDEAAITDMWNKAIESYNMSIAKDSTYLHPYFNGGAVYIKLANTINKKRDALSYKEVEKDKKLKAEQDAIYQKAIAMFEACTRIAPEDLAAYEALKKIYFNMGEFEKKTAIEKRIAELQK